MLVLALSYDEKLIHLKTAPEPVRLPAPQAFDHAALAYSYVMMTKKGLNPAKDVIANLSQAAGVREGESGKDYVQE